MFGRVAILLLLCLGLLQAQTLRFGITSVAIKDDLFAVREWANFLERQSGLDIQVVFAKNYDEIKYLLENGGVDFAYVCGATYVKAKENAQIEVLSLPYVQGSATYYSLSIARNDSRFDSLFDFQGAHYAFSDPRSNSGAIVPVYVLQKAGWDYRRFFGKVIYTYDHAESILAVAEGFVDGASVDSIVFDNFSNIYPQIAETIKVIDRFGPFTTTPIVVRQNLPAATRQTLQNAFSQMAHDPSGQAVLSRFGIDWFETPKDYDYGTIEHMINTIRGHKWE